jgi:hypothetical protein
MNNNIPVLKLLRGGSVCSLPTRKLEAARVIAAEQGCGFA